MSSAAPTKDTAPGIAMYGPLFLRFYDFWVLSFTNAFAWKCSTTGVLLPLFRSSIGQRHMDVGVGTGYFPANGIPGSACKEITLVDLNPNTLTMAEDRIRKSTRGSGGGVAVKTVVGDATQSLPISKTEKYDSVSLYFLLHCMPGPLEHKMRILSTVKNYLKPDGVLFGSTVLGREAPCNWIAQKLMNLYNRKGIFDNWDDNVAELKEGLERSYADVNIWTVGRVALFTAKGPKA